MYPNKLPASLCEFSSVGLCWTLGPIGGPAFSSQTLLWWPLEYNHNLPWVKPYLQVSLLFKLLFCGECAGP